MRYYFMTGPVLIEKFHDQLIHSHYIAHLMSNVERVETVSVRALRPPLRHPSSLQAFWPEGRAEKGECDDQLYVRFFDGTDR